MIQVGRKQQGDVMERTESAEDGQEQPLERRREHAEGPRHGGACQAEDLVGTDWAERAMGSCHVGRSVHGLLQLEQSEDDFPGFMGSIGVFNYRQS